MAEIVKPVPAKAETPVKVQRPPKPVVEVAPGLELPMGFKSYQDIWLKGQVIQDGKRTCARRYKLIFDALAERYRPGFTLLDIGASEGYFSIRLAEELNARPTMMEKKREIVAIANAQGNKNLTPVIGRFDKDTIAKQGNFDVVIALSIVHHFPDWGQIIKQILSMGDTIIIELPAQNERSTKRADSATGMLDVLHWYNPKLIGETAGYAEETKRQLWVVDFPAPPTGPNVVQATVAGGRSSSARQSKHYRAGFQKHFGMPVFPGTLNLKLTKRFHFKSGFRVPSDKGDYFMFPCKFEGLPAFVVKPPRAKNRSNTLEILAPVSLREVFGLVDGSTVIVELDSQYLGTKDEIQYEIKLPVVGTITGNEGAAEF